MVGFRKVAVHEYTRLNLDIGQAIIETRVDQLLAFSQTAVRSDSSGV